jgi:hypothetical protein
VRRVNSVVVEISQDFEGNDTITFMPATQDEPLVVAVLAAIDARNAALLRSVTGNEDPLIT